MIRLNLSSNLSRVNVKVCEMSRAEMTLESKLNDRQGFRLAGIDVKWARGS
jgi:hypothetical protein